MIREYSLQFERGVNEALFMLEVVDDNIAENDEIFIVYPSVNEDSDDNCASAVLLQDNHGQWEINHMHNEWLIIH